jgi:hypothetical protein
MRADVVVLQNGDRIEGRIVGENADEIRIERWVAGGQSTYTTTIDRLFIASVERSPARSASQPAETQPLRGAAVPASAPADPSRFQPSSRLDAATQRALAGVVAKWRAEDFGAAGMDISRLINAARPDNREEMSAWTQAAIHMSLAEFAADTHYKAAVSGQRGAAIRLQYVTEYEKPVLTARLIEAYAAAIRDRGDNDSSETVPHGPVPPVESGWTTRSPGAALSVDRSGAAARPRSSPTTQPWYAHLPPPQSRPASAPAPAEVSSAEQATFSVADWLDRAEQFDGTAAQARALAPRVYHAASLLNERMRLDPAFRKNLELKRKLLGEKQRLSALSRAVASRAGRVAPKPAPPKPAGDPETPEQQARREAARKQFQAEQDKRQQQMQDAIEAAKGWQVQQPEQTRPFSLFNWLKSPDPPGPPSPPPVPGQP